MCPQPTALILEDDHDQGAALTAIVEGSGFSVRYASDIAEARALLDRAKPDLALLDLELPDGVSLELLTDLIGGARTTVVYITGHASVPTAIEAMRGGATDYLEKPVDVARLRLIMDEIRAGLTWEAETDVLRAEIAAAGGGGRIVGSSLPMVEVFRQLLRVSKTDATVLVTGPTGTGKELVARTVHELSARAERAFVSVNCGAIPATLIESTFFGHERGAFTGADRRRAGLFEQADGGTLFLDEITEMDPDLQVRLLRVLETNEVNRIGSEQMIPVDVRIVAATNRPPTDAVADGKLREDLYYRLNVFPISLPPLAQRGADITRLAAFFLDQHNQRSGSDKRFSEATEAKLLDHDWPGNVRELRHVVERACILADDLIEPKHLALESSTRDEPGFVRARVGTSISTMERALIEATLDQYDGDKPAAAKALGISLKTLYNRLNAYRTEDGQPPRKPDEPSS